MKHNQANAVSGEGKRHNLRPRSLHAKPSDFTVPLHALVASLCSCTNVMGSCFCIDDGAGGGGACRVVRERRHSLGTYESSCMRVLQQVCIHEADMRWPRHVICHIQNKSHDARAKQSGRPLSSNRLNRLNVRCALSIYLPEASASEPASASASILSILTPLGSRPSAA